MCRMQLRQLSSPGGPYQGEGGVGDDGGGSGGDGSGGLVHLLLSLGLDHHAGCRYNTRYISEKKISCGAEALDENLRSVAPGNTVY